MFLINCRSRVTMGGAHVALNVDTKTIWAGKYSVDINYLLQQDTTVADGGVDGVLIDIQSQDASRGTYTVTVLPNQVVPEGTAIAQAYYRCSPCDNKRVLYVTSTNGVSVSFLAKNNDNLTVVTKGIFDGDYESSDLVAILNGKFKRVLG